MLKKILNFLKRKQVKERWIWYCTRCGFDDIMHDENGRLLGSCPVNSQMACPLDIKLQSIT